MNELELLQKVLETSIKRNGQNYPLTLSHLKNLIGVVQRMKELRDCSYERFLDKLANEFSDPNL